MIDSSGDTSRDRLWKRRDAPVFAVSSEGGEVTYPNGDTLPSLWVTEPISDEDGRCNGRMYEMIYPYRDQGFICPVADDSDGTDALYYGGGYYDEGMGYTDPVDREKRIDCFRAAEILYRHSAGRGNVVANMCLGYVYSYDRCEGKYWRSSMAVEADKGFQRTYPREERAFACFKIAAEAGMPEACYKVGDLCKHGTGCDPDAGQAFRWYVRASELARRERPVILGSIALRLAECYEEGFGCGQDFSRALEWYEKAVAGLEVAVEEGESWYAKALAGARAGVKRCKQEIAP